MIRNPIIYTTVPINTIPITIRINPEKYTTLPFILPEIKFKYVIPFLEKKPIIPVIPIKKYSPPRNRT